MTNIIYDLYLIAFGQIMQQNKELSMDDIVDICNNDMNNARYVEQMIHESRFIQYNRQTGKHSKKMDFDFKIHGLI